MAQGALYPVLVLCQYGDTFGEQLAGASRSVVDEMLLVRQTALLRQNRGRSDGHGTCVCRGRRAQEAEKDVEWYALRIFLVSSLIS